MKIYLLLLLRLWSATAAPTCHICGKDGNNAMKYPEIVLKSGKTCTEIAMETAMKIPPNTKKCETTQKAWHEDCCSGKHPEGRMQSTSRPQQNIPVVKKTGPYPLCNICRDGDYPYNTGMVVNFLYLGEGSCAQYYVFGLEGKIPRKYCSPVQFFSYEPCGCGEYNPYFRKEKEECRTKIL